MNIAAPTKTKPIVNRATEGRRSSLGELSEAGQARGSAALLKRVLPEGGEKGIEVAAFGSSI